MTKHLTRKDINLLRELGFTVYNVPNHHEAQNLLVGCDSFGYNAGVYGWNWSAYKIHDSIIVTGYRNLPPCGEHIPNLAEHEAAAAEILLRCSTPRSEKTEKLNELRTKLFASA